MAPPRFSRVQLRVCTSALLVALPFASGGVLAQTTTAASAQTSHAPAAGVAVEAPAAATPDAQSELEATFWRGDDLFQQGAFAEAAVLFTKALELSHRSEVSDTWRQFSPNIAFNVAHSHRRAGNCEAAQMAFAHYRGLVEALPAEHVEWQASLIAECPALQKNTDATNEVSPPRSQTPEPRAATGPEASEPTAAGTWLLDVNTKPSATNDARAVDVGRVVGWSAAGAAVVSLGLAGAFWVSADNQQDLADSKRLWAEAEGHQSAADTRRLVAGIFTGVGVALGGAGVYLLTRPAAEASSRQSAIAALALRSHGTNISVWGQF